MNRTIQTECKKAGIAHAWLVPPLSSPLWQEAQKAGRIHSNAASLYPDTRAAYPWANALLLLAQPYAPFPADCRISAYYIAANTFYHTVKTLIDGLNCAGIRADLARIPLRAVFLEAGLGQVGKNALLSLGAAGTRIVLQALVLNVPLPHFDTIIPEKQTLCANCRACQNACPTGAIDDMGWHEERCIRAHLYDEPTPQWVIRHSDTLLGCEYCQNACPRNALLPVVKPAPAQINALFVKRIMAGDLGPALALVGKNLKKNLIKSASIIMAGKEPR